MTRSSADRRIAGGIGWLVSSNVAARALALLVMPVLTRLLPPEAYGGASLCGTAIALGSVVALAGTDMSYSRQYHATAAPNGVAVERVCWRTAIAATAVVAVLMLVGALVFVTPRRLGVASESGTVLLIAATVSGLICSVLATMAQVRRRLAGEYRRVSFALTTSAIVGSGLAICIALMRDDALALVLATVAAYACTVMLLGVPRIATLTESDGLRWGERWQVLRVGFAGLATAPAFWVLTGGDKWLVAELRGLSEAGIYALGFNIGFLGMLATNAITSVWLPEASRLHESGGDSTEALAKLAAQLVLVVLVIWVGVTAFGGDMVRLLAAREFAPAAAVVPVVATGVMFYGLMHIANAGLLLQHRLGLAVIAWAAAAALFMVCAWLWIPAHGAIGAAYAQCLAFALVALLVWRAAHPVMPVLRHGPRLAAAAIVLVVTAYATASPWSDAAVTSMASKVPLFLAAAAISTWITLGTASLVRLVRDVVGPGSSGD